MITPKANQQTLIRQEVGGGQGELHGIYALVPGQTAVPTCFQMIGRMTLQPGCSVGVHPHADNEETYYILSGTGLYTDDDGSTHQLYPGDCTVTTRGQRHGLANNGTEPLVFLAVIAG